MSTELRLCASVAICLTVFLSSGCGSSDSPDLGRVEGLVTLDGKPLQGATVTVIPTGGRPSQGVVDSDGHYVLTYKPKLEGVLPGTHPIRVEPPHQEPEGADQMNENQYAAAVEKLNAEFPMPAEWRNGSTKITVEPGDQEFNIEMVSQE